MSRCVIVSAATIKNYSKIKQMLLPDDYYIFCDGGLKHKKKLGVKPDLIIGDFDSHKKPLESRAQIIQLPKEKDDTDTFFAVKHAVSKGFNDFLLVGMIGDRFDHSLCNISMLLFLEQEGKSAQIADDFGIMEILGESEKSISSQYSFFSLMNVCGDVSGVYISGAKYPLENGSIPATYSYGISNEVLPGQVAKVRVESGKLLLLKIY